MPRISVNLSDVEAYESLPIDEYLGDITKIELKPTDKEGKFDQLMVSYQVVDGDLIGRVSSEWLSLSPKAAFRLKKWFGKFGLGDIEDLDINDETNMLDEPDLVGTRVIFKVYADKPRPGDTEPSIRTALVSVEDSPVQAGRVMTTMAESVAETEPEDEDPQGRQKRRHWPLSSRLSMRVTMQKRRSPSRLPRPPRPLLLRPGVSSDRRGVSAR